MAYTRSVRAWRVPSLIGPGGGRDGTRQKFVVTAVGETTAAIEWMATWNADSDYPAAIAASRQAVVVASEGGAVRATIRLSARCSGGSAGRSSDLSNDSGVTVTITGNRAFAAAATTNSELEVRSYNARSGRVRWRLQATGHRHTFKATRPRRGPVPGGVHGRRAMGRFPMSHGSMQRQG